MEISLIIKKEYEVIITTLEKNGISKSDIFLKGLESYIKTFEVKNKIKAESEICKLLCSCFDIKEDMIPNVSIYDFNYSFTMFTTIAISVTLKEYIETMTSYFSEKSKEKLKNKILEILSDAKKATDNLIFY